MTTTASGPTTRDMELMQQRLDEANAKVDHLNRLVTYTERQRDRYRERAERGELAYVAVREIAALVDSASDKGLRAAVTAVVAATPPMPAPEPVKRAAEPSPIDTDPFELPRWMRLIAAVDALLRRLRPAAR